MTQASLKITTFPRGKGPRMPQAKRGLMKGGRRGCVCEVKFGDPSRRQLLAAGGVPVRLAAGALLPRQFTSIYIRIPFDLLITNPARRLTISTYHFLATVKAEPRLPCPAMNATGAAAA